MDPSGVAAGASRRLRILVVHSELPLHDRHSGSLRLFRLLELLAGEGHAVTFLARRGLGQEHYAAELTALGIDVHPLDRARLRELGAHLPGPELDFAELCVRGRFDVAVLSFYDLAEQYLPLLRRHSPLTRVVVDTVDVHHVRERRGAELSGDPTRLAAAERTRERERAVYGAADALIAVSEDDAAALRELAPEVPVHVVSNVHAAAPDGPAFGERAGLVFVANFAHAPNVDAILDFHATAWPLVRAALPGVRLTLVGSDPPPAVRALAAADVEVTGWVPETVPHLDRARVSIAPLRYGAGVKGKVGEALSHGLPVVTTAIGAEGMGIVDGEHALVADGPAAFAAAVARLHEQRALWERLAAAGRAHVAGSLSPDVARDALRALLRERVPQAFVLAVDAADPTSLSPMLAGYLAAFAPDDPVSLVLAVPPADAQAPERVFAAAATELTRLGRDPDGIPDVAISGWDATLPLPASAVLLDTEPVPVDFRLDRPAPPRRLRPTPRAALLLHAPDDPGALRAQLDALAAAGVPDDVELVVAAGDPTPETTAVLHAAASGARIVRTPGALGRFAAWQLGALATRAPRVVALAPLALPARGFLDPLLGRLAGGDAPALAAPAVAGAHGLRVAADGSLWPRAAGAVDEQPLDALPLDCLAATRELLAAGLPELPAGEGHREAQLARWAAVDGRGGIALAPASAVSRLAPPAASVVICTRDRADELPDGVALLVAHGARDVVIVDNGSSDATPEAAAELAARFPGVVRVVEEPNAGLCHARNAGAAAARHDLLLYVDDDARVAPGWLEHMAHALARPGTVNAGGPICALWPPERRAGWPGRDLEALLSVLDLGDAERLLAPPDVVYGANWAVRRAALDAVGGFDPAFGPGPGAAINGDEVSVAWRLHRAGLGATRYVPGAVAGHRIGAERVEDRFMQQRALCVGVERPRHAVALGDASREQLVADAGRAAQRLLSVLPLRGELTVGSAMETIARSGLPLAAQVQAAMALGELGACVLLAGEHEVGAGELSLALHDELLQGALAPPALAR
ncbi:MAG TPA: glycosyltransferase [Conexibacter sp.]|jgi:GT2 family glycosyltransferase/glycosyltransferase involved in cell wall biosynthesis|nr:glycosyltransferase [Conexibacter sp.]